MNRRDSGARLSVYCTSAVARNLRVPVKALFFGPFFSAERQVYLYLLQG